MSRFINALSFSPGNKVNSLDLLYLKVTLNTMLNKTACMKTELWNNEWFSTLFLN